MFDNEELDIFTKGEFSTTAIVDSVNSSITELTGIFDTNYQDMFGGFDAQPAEARKFCFLVQTNETNNLRHADRLTINNQNYQIISLQPTHDGKLINIILKQDFS